jgi:hypothetical protein
VNNELQRIFTGSIYIIVVGTIPALSWWDLRKIARNLRITILWAGI